METGQGTPVGTETDTGKDMVEIEMTEDKEAKVEITTETE